MMIYRRIKDLREDADKSQEEIAKILTQEHVQKI